MVVTGCGNTGQAAAQHCTDIAWHWTSCSTALRWYCMTRVVTGGLVIAPVPAWNLLVNIRQSHLIWAISVLLHVYKVWSNCSLAFIDSVGIWSCEHDVNWENTTSKWSPEQKCTSLSCVASLSTTAVTVCTDRLTCELRVTLNKRPVYCL